MAIIEMAPLAPITVVTGHYGVGKTNFSLNLALDAARAGQKVTLVDLDVVNPYFRSSDYVEQLEKQGIRLIAPVFAGTTLDSPSLSGAIEGAVIDAVRNAHASGGEPGDSCLILDAGGDDVGSTALGRFAHRIAAVSYTMFYVVNRYRNLTQDAREAAEILAEIEHKSHLSATALVSNSHMQQETTLESVVNSLLFAQEVSDLCKLPIVCIALPNNLVDQKSIAFSEIEKVSNVYPVRIYVRAPWDAPASFDLLA